MTRFVEEGTCRTCGQDLVQVLRDGEPIRTYHPVATTTVECLAMRKIDGETYNDTDHVQFVPTEVEPTARLAPLWLIDDAHAFIAGQVAGLLIRSGLRVWPERDEHGAYLASMWVSPEEDMEPRFRIAVLPPSKEGNDA